MARTLVITFEDGRTESVRLNTRCLVEAERKFGDMGRHAIEGTYYAAWFRLGRPGGDFDAWLDTVDDAREESGSTDGEPVPTQPEASAGS